MNVEKARQDLVKKVDRYSTFCNSKTFQYDIRGRDYSEKRANALEKEARQALDDFKAAVHEKLRAAMKDFAELTAAEHVMSQTGHDLWTGRLKEALKSAAITPSRWVHSINLSDLEAY